MGTTQSRRLGNAISINFYCASYTHVHTRMCPLTNSILIVKTEVNTTMTIWILHDVFVVLAACCTAVLQKELPKAPRPKGFNVHTIFHCKCNRDHTSSRYQNLMLGVVKILPTKKHANITWMAMD